RTQHHTSAAHSTVPTSDSVFTAPHPPHPDPLSLHDALPISCGTGSGVLIGLSNPMREAKMRKRLCVTRIGWSASSASRRIFASRSEEHTSELQSRFDLVCRLLLEKKTDEIRYALERSR